MKRLPKNLVVAVGVAVLLIGVLFVAAYAMPAPAPLEVVDCRNRAQSLRLSRQDAGPDRHQKVARRALPGRLAKGRPFGVTAEAFNHWPTRKEVPADCAKCHTSEGYREFVAPARRRGR